MPLAPAHLTIEVSAPSSTRRTLSVSVAEPAVRAELDHALRQFATRARLPGFRKGKAPIAAVERQYGGTVRREALQRVIDEAYGLALAERALEPLAEGELESVDYTPDAGLVFRISFEVRPEIELARLDGLRVARPAALVRPEQVDEALDRLREEHALWRPADEPGPPADGDLVTVRIVPLSATGQPVYGGQENVGLPWARRLRLRAGTQHRGRYQIVIGAGDAEPDVEAVIRTLTPGETREATLPLADDAGGTRERRLRITVEDRQIRDLPELDDAFALSLGDFDDVAALRAKLANDLQEEAADRAEAVLRARLLDLIVDANPFDVPDVMVDRYLETLLGEAEDASAEAGAPGRDTLRSEAERAVKRTLVLDRIAELHGLKATDVEVAARVAEIAARGQVTPDRVRDQLVRTGQLDRLAADITNAKVFDFLKRRSEIVAEEGEGT